MSALVCVPAERVGRLAWLAALALAWWAIVGTHDYMEWNRARYAGLALLARDGVDVREIDGGVEHNAWRLAAELGT